MAYLEELLPEFRKGAKIRCKKWSYGEYVYLGEKNIIYDERNKRYEFVNDDLFVEWELYQEPDPDWDYIIENKCLCWFWDDDEDKEIKKISTFLYAKPRKSNKSFIDIAGSNWKNCRPVRRDEVTFYEDKKDE